MPTYNLKCTNKDCGYRWEDFMSIREKEQAECPKCHYRAVTDYGAKQSGSILIKGAGFYAERVIR